ncbi:MAG: NAD(P)H-hydrate dehydratase, partial [Oscillospiraceae bacterium]|nr:NAD(P)H-hydrate dehydratase [Oscillospiraceae bacterium]
EGVEIELFDPESEDMIAFLNGCGVIIDAIFGIGLSRNVEGVWLEAVQCINRSPAPVVSADIPTGVEADTGRILGDAVKADVTVTFTLAKPGHFITPGAGMRGRLIVADIGIPRKLANRAGSNVTGITVNDLYIPQRESESYKWDYGRVLVIAGSVGYTGAPVMASKAALKTGSGLVFLAVPDAIYDICAVKSDEVMVVPYASSDEGLFSRRAIGALKEKMTGCDVCLLGPGLGRGAEITELVGELIRSSKTPLILDADGLNAVSLNINILRKASCPIIVTPHEREFIRMGGDLSGGRLAGALKFAAKYNCIVVLKGSGTITALPNGTAFVNTTGNPGMAKGGSGDILAGMIASLIGQKFPAAQAAAYGVFIHGLTGDICKKNLTEYAMTPTDMLDATAEAFRIITRK